MNEFISHSVIQDASIFNLIPMNKPTIFFYLRENLHPLFPDEANTALLGTKFFELQKIFNPKFF